MRILPTLLILILLPACVFTREKENASYQGVTTKLQVRQAAQEGFLGVDKAGYNSQELESEAKGATDKLSRLDDLLGQGFDPNDIKAPNYGKAKYKSGVAKEYLLDELMTEAYGAYKEVTGKKWYPKKSIQAKESNDPLLRKDRWLLKKNKSLHDILLSWARKAQWQMVWRSEYEYPVRVGTLFRGSFPKAVEDVLATLENRTPRLTATFYKNRVVVFSNEGSP